MSDELEQLKMRFPVGTPVQVVISQSIDPRGVVIDHKFDPHLPWPQVQVRHEGIGAQHPFRPEEREHCFWWPVYSVSHRDESKL